MTQLVEEHFFEIIEVFYLIVGHTHNPLDQWFSVLSKAIRKADFIGSVLALHEIYKLVHKEDTDKTINGAAKVIQLETYHDWRAYYDPVRNENIHHYNIPHLFKFERDPQSGVGYMQYQLLSPPSGAKWVSKWLPPKVSFSFADNEKENLDRTNSIELQKFMIFDGRENVCKALGVPTDATILDVMTSNESTRHNIGNALESIQLVERIEKSAIGEMEVRMDIEAGEEEEVNKNIASKGIKLTQDMLRYIDDEMVRNNSVKSANIVWLKRSRNPDALSTRPDILPNPLLWRQIVAADRLEENDRFSKKEKSIAKSRLIAFDRGVSDMVSTAKNILSLVHDGRIERAESDDISKATRKFTHAALTSREIEFYQNISSPKFINENAERLLQIELRKPWVLLNLPAETELQIARRDTIRQQRLQQQAEIEARLRKSLIRRGEEEYNPDHQVIEFDGVKLLSTTDISTMKKKDLQTLAKGHIRGFSVMSHNDLRQALLTYINANPGKLSVSSFEIPTVAPSVDQTTESESLFNSAVTIEEEELEVKECSVQECEEICGEQKCNVCELWYCMVLHKSHESHLQMQLRDNKIPKVGSMAWDLPKQIIPNESIQNNHDAITSSNNSSSKRQKISNESNSNNMDIPSHRVLNAANDVSNIIEKADSSSSYDTLYDSLYEVLNYPSYDVEFLYTLSSYLEIDININRNNSKRVTKVMVLDSFINSLLESR